MQRLEVSGAVRPIYGSLGVKRLRADGTAGIPATVRSRVFLSYRSPFKNTKIKICSNVILLVVAYGCETRSLTLKEEQTNGIEAQSAQEGMWD